MIALALDGVGGLLAAIIGPLYISHSVRSRRRVRAIAELIIQRDPKAGSDRTSHSRLASHALHPKVIVDRPHVGVGTRGSRASRARARSLYRS
ncbi:MAG TPA: hypothetical protein VGM90_28830 [Kofleriaceae bacterium]|jgi:hypothetical protein